MPVLSIVMPAYNEAATIHLILDKVRDCRLPEGWTKELIVVNDCSKDGTEAAIERYASANPSLPLTYRKHEVNQGKGAALHTGIAMVFGSRFMGGNAHRILFFWHSIGNKFLTFLSNMFTNLNLTDMETCYKLFRRDLIQSLNLRENRFGFEPEVTAKIARVPKVRIYEVGISYYGRTFEEGKKIGWKDGVRAIYCILKYGAFKSR